MNGRLGGCTGDVRIELVTRVATDMTTSPSVHLDPLARQLVLILAFLGLTFAGSVGVAPAAQAAGTSYNDSDPYATGCNSGASLIHTHYAGGGKLDMSTLGRARRTGFSGPGPTCARGVVLRIIGVVCRTTLGCLGIVRSADPSRSRHRGCCGSRSPDIGVPFVQASCPGETGCPLVEGKSRL